MSHKVAKKVKAESGARLGARLVLLLLADRADDAGVCWPGNARLCKEAGLGDRQMVRVLQALEKSGELIILKRGDGRGNPSVYRLAKYAIAPFNAADYAEILASGKGDKSSKKGDKTDTISEAQEGVKGDISDEERVTFTTLKGDISDNALIGSESSGNHSPLSPPRVGAFDVDVEPSQSEQQAEAGESSESKQPEQAANQAGSGDENSTGTEGSKAEGDNTPEQSAKPKSRRRAASAAAAVVLAPEQQRLFECWYQHYPNKAGRQKAVEAWAKINPDEVTVKAMAEGLKRWKESRDWKVLGAVKHPATWLNQRNWEDYPQRADEVPVLGSAKGQAMIFGTAANSRPSGPAYREWKGDD